MGIVARQSIKASIAGFIGVGIGAITKLFLMTKFLSLEEIGLIETIMKLGVLLSPFFILGFTAVVFRFYNNSSLKDKQETLTSFGFIAISSSSILASIFFILFKDFIISLYPEAKIISEYIYLVLVVAIATAFFNYFRILSVLKSRLTVPEMLNSLVNRSFIFVLIVLYGFGFFHLFGENKFTFFTYFYIVLFYVAPLVLLIFYLLKYHSLSFKLIDGKSFKEIFRTTFRYNFFMIFSSLSIIVIQAIDVNMISSKLGLSFSGIYIIAFYIASIIDIPMRSLSMIIFPKVNKAYAENDFSQVSLMYKKSAINQFYAGLLLFTLIWLNLDSLFLIIPNGDDYAKGKLIVLFIGISKLIEMMTSINKQIIEVSEYYFYNLINSVLLSLMLIGLNLIFITIDHPIYGGINGVALASLIAVFISNLLSTIIVYLKDKIHPFSSKILLIFLPFFISYAILMFINIVNPIVSIAFKSLLIGLIFLISLVIFKLSDDFLLILRNLMNWKNNKNVEQ